MFKAINGGTGLIPEGKYLFKVKNKETKEQCPCLLF